MASRKYREILVSSLLLQYGILEKLVTFICGLRSITGVRPSLVWPQSRGSKVEDTRQQGRWSNKKKLQIVIIWISVKIQRNFFCVCLNTIKGRQKNNESEKDQKVFIRTKKCVWRKNKDYMGGATCWSSSWLYKTYVTVGLKNRTRSVFEPPQY